MGLKEKIIKKLEKDVEITAGTIDLNSVDDETREKLFQQFGEGDQNLTKFLKTAYNHGAPSIHCCSGHRRYPAYVTLKVTDENLDMIRNLGKVLSNYKVVTNFTDDYKKGKYVHFQGFTGNLSTEWLELASQVIENPELYDSNNPSKYYHEEFYSSYKPFGFDLKKKLLHFLRGDKKQLSSGTDESNFNDGKTDDTKWWDLTTEQKGNIKPIQPTKSQDMKENLAPEKEDDAQKY